MDVEAQDNSIEMKEFEIARKKAFDAHNALLTKIFGSVPEDPSKLITTREVYTKAMKEVEKEFNIAEGGDPSEVMLFMLEQLSRSPKFEEEEGN